MQEKIFERKSSWSCQGGFILDVDRVAKIFYCACCALPIGWPEGLCGTVSYKSVNFPQFVAVSKMVEYHETLITSLVTRPGSASTLAIIERIWSGFFRLIFGFVGFSSMFVQGFISASRHRYRFERKRCVVKRSHICVLLWTLQTHPFRKNVNWKANKGKRK